MLARLGVAIMRRGKQGAPPIQIVALYDQPRLAPHGQKTLKNWGEFHHCIVDCVLEDFQSGP